MDKSKSRDTLRAAGKKRLEQFRQQKQKGTTSKSSSTALKVEADEDTSLSKVLLDSNSSITEHDDDLQQKSEGQAPNISEGSVIALELEAEPPKGGQYHEDDDPIPAERNLQKSLSQNKGFESSAESVANDVVESLSMSTAVTELNSSGGTYPGEGENGMKKLLKSTTSTEDLTGSGPDNSLQEPSSLEGVADRMLLTSSSNSSDIQGFEQISKYSAEVGAGLTTAVDEQQMTLEADERKFGTDIQDWKLQVEKLAEEKEHISNQLFDNAEQQLQETSMVKSLMVEVEFIQEKLSFMQKEKVQLSQELASSQKELQIVKEHLSSELLASQQRVVASEHETSVLLKKLELAKQEIREANAKFSSELESIQQLLTDEQVKRTRLMTELTTSNEEKEQNIKELEASKICVQTLEDHLSSEQITLQQIQELVKKDKDSREKLEASILAKEDELNVCRAQVQRMEAENLGLKDAVEEFRHCYEHSKRMNEQFRVDLEARREKYDEQLRKLGEEKGKLAGELEKSKSLNDEHVQIVANLEVALDKCSKMVDCMSEEKSKFVQELNSANERLLLLTEEKGNEVATLGSELRECKDLVRMKFEENSSLVMLLEESTSKLESNAQSMLEMTVELEKHRVLCDGLVQEKGTLSSELLELREQWQLMQQTAKDHESELERCKECLKADATRAKAEFVAYREQIAKLEEQNTILVKLLEDSKNDLQRLREDNLQSSADLASELDQHRLLSSGLLEEKARPASELQDVIEKWQVLQLEMAGSVRDHISDLEQHRKQSRELDENCIKLSNDLMISQNDISKLMEEKSLADLELARYKEQLTKLEDINKDLVGGLDEHRQRLDVIVDEKTKLLGDHASELGRFKEQLRALEDTNVKQIVHVGKLLSDLQNLDSEKSEMGVELRIWNEKYDKMADEKHKLESDFNHCRDQLQLLMEEKELGESRLASEVEKYQDQVQRLGEKNTLLEMELENQREHLQRVNEQVDEMEKVNLQVQELVRSQEQAVSELTVTCQRARELEIAKMELLSNVEELSQQLKEISEEKGLIMEDLEVSRRQLQEKGQLLLNFEVSSNNWQSEKLQLSRDLDESLRNQQILIADKAVVDSELAEVKFKAQEMDAKQTHLAKEVASLNALVQTREDEIAQLLAQMEDRNQQVQTLPAEKNQLFSGVQSECEKLLVLTSEVASLTENLEETKLSIMEVEKEMNQLRADYKFSQQQLDLLAEDKIKLADALLKSSHELEVFKGEQSKRGPENLLKPLQIHEQIALIAEEPEGMKILTEARERELDQMKIQYSLLQNELEVSDKERCGLAQELITLRFQLQQISQKKSHVADELALGVEASRLRMREIEEMKQESMPKLDKAIEDRDVLASKDDGTLGNLPGHDGPKDTQDSRRLTFETNVPMPESTTLQSERALGDILPLESLDANPSAKLEDAGICLASHVTNLVQEFERKAHDSIQSSGTQQHFHGFPKEMAAFFSQMKVLQETSRNLEQQRDDAQNIEYTLHLELQTEAGHLQKAVEENLHLTALVEQLEGEQHQVETAFVQVAELRNQLRDLADKVVNLQVEKDTVMEALFAAQAEVRQSKENLEEENNLLKCRLKVLEGTVASLQTERDALAGKLVDLEQNHTDMSERALQDSEAKETLQDKVATFEFQLFERNNELENHRVMVSQYQLHVQSLIQKLEDSICDAFPGAGQKLLSLKDEKNSPEYCFALVSRLHSETTDVRDQLQNVHVQLAEIGKQLSQTEEHLDILQQERNVASKVSEQVHSQLEKAAGEKEDLEAYLKKLEAVASAEKQDLVAQINELTQKHDTQLAQDASDNAALQSEVASLQERIRAQQSALEMDATRFSRLEAEVKAIVSKLLSGTLIAQEEGTKDLNLLNPDPGSQLEECISLLLKKCEDRDLQIEDLKQRVVLLSADSEQMLQNHEEEGANLKHVLQPMQEMLHLEELEVDKLKKRVEEKTTTVSHQKTEIEVLLLQIQGLNEELEKRDAEKEALQLGVTQAEQKLSVTREKLSLAVNKGKAVVQQRDAWKLAVTEKSKELDLLVAAHQQELRVKEVSLHNAEMKIRELRASVERLVTLETEFDSLHNAVTAAETLFQQSDDLYQGLSAVVDGSIMPHDWHSNELVDKIVWIIGSMSKVLQKLESMNEEVHSLTETASSLATAAEDSQTRAASFAAELGLLKEEKAFQVEDNNRLQLELHQMTQEKAQLSGIIRQLDLDVVTQKHAKEDYAKRLEDQAKDIARFEIEIANLVKKVAEQEELNKSVVSHQSLEATVDTLVRNLADIYETISPGELDVLYAQSSLDFCKDIVKLLISNHNVIVEKLNEILHQASGLSLASGQASHDPALWTLEDKVSSRGLSIALIKKIDEAFVNIEQQAISSHTLLRQIDGLADNLASERDEKNRLQLELTQNEQRLTTLREKLTSAVSKGKSLVQQRDNLKQLLAENNAELEKLVSAHEEEIQSKELILHEISQKLESTLDHVVDLEEELVTLKSDADPSLIDRLSETNRSLSEMQLKSDLALSEAESTRKIAAHLSSELELSQSRLNDLGTELSNVMKDKEELARRLESCSSQYRAELQRMDTEKMELVSKVGKLEIVVASQQQEREKIVQSFEDISHKYDELKSQTGEAVAERAMLHAEIEILQHKIADLGMSLQMEMESRMKLVSDMEAVVSWIQRKTGEPILERSFDSTISIPSSSQSRSQLGSLGTFLITRHEAAMQEIEELSRQNAQLAESQESMVANSLCEQQILQQLQAKLASRDPDFKEVSKRMEEAVSRSTEQEEIVQALLQEVRMLTEDLAKEKSEREALQGELIQVQDKSATTREKLGLAIKKGKGLAQQRDSLKQSILELELVISNSKEGRQNKESALEKANYEMAMWEEKVKALELEVSSLRSFAFTLEQDLRAKDELKQEVETLLAKWEFPVEWQSRELTEKLEWLVEAVSGSQSSFILAGQESEALKKAFVQLSSELTDAQIRADLEQESRSNLALRLEESERNLQRSQKRIQELEAHLSAVGRSDEQAELLSKQVINLETILQQKQAEVSRAEEAVFAWAERFEESEKYIRSNEDKISELEGKVEELAGAQQKVEILYEKIANLEEAVQQKQAAVKAIEASRGKAVNKLTTTVNKFRELCQQSEGLVVELERMHGNLLDKDTEISRLREEIEKISRQSRSLQETLDSKNSFMLQLEKHLEIALHSGNDSEVAAPVTSREDFDHVKVKTLDEGNCLENVKLLQKRLEGLTAQSQSWQADVERKNVQLQGMRKQLEEVVAEKTRLKANLQREQLQSEKLKEDFASMHPPLIERVSNQIEEIEEVQVGKRSLPTSLAPHVRGARKPASFDVAIDMDSETNLLAEFDDKGHGFKSLASSRFMPRGTRSMAEQIDKLCVAGGRVLMRQPGARLGLTMYWLTIHIWMVFLIFTAHI